jgi:formate hydrogenlyase subunit 6/NADH:ubiquinone oxidoreductase subunit I
LAALSISTYVELANADKTHVTVRCDACGDCPIGQLAKQINNTVQAARPLTPMTIDVVTETPTTGKAPSPLHNTNRPVISRRGLFQIFTGGAQPKAPPPTYPASLPLERQRLLTALAERPDLSSAWVTSLIVEGACTACEVCTRICPTDALMINSGRTDFQLNVNAAYCTGCGLCAAACPEEVLHIDPEPVAADPPTVPLTTLTIGSLRHCKRCKTTFSGSSDLCPACDFRRKNPFGSKLIKDKS